MKQLIVATQLVWSEDISQSWFVWFLIDEEKNFQIKLTVSPYLSFNQHCHVHEHRMELSDAQLQTHDVLVPWFYLI